MFDHAAITENQMTLADTLPPVALLLGGVPTVTVFVMAAARYVASGTF